MAQHTPGPWEVTIGNRGTLCVTSEEAWICGELQNGNGEVPDETRANAFLIAAAPTLLDLAKDYLGVIKHCISQDEKAGDLEGANLKRLTLARTALIIADAEGN